MEKQQELALRKERLASVKQKYTVTYKHTLGEYQEVFKAFKKKLREDQKNDTENEGKVEACKRIYL